MHRLARAVEAVLLLGLNEGQTGVDITSHWQAVGEKVQTQFLPKFQVKVARALFLMNAAIWILFGVSSLTRTGNSIANHASAVWIISILMFGNALVMLWTGVGIGKQGKRFYYLQFEAPTPASGSGPLPTPRWPSFWLPPSGSGAFYPPC